MTNEEKPKRKRGESPLTRTINIPLYLLLIVLAAVILLGIVWLAGNLAQNAMNISPEQEAELATEIGIAFGVPPALDCSAYLPPSGERIAYRSAADSLIYLLTTENDVRCLLPGATPDAINLALSTDGNRLAYVAETRLGTYSFTDNRAINFSDDLAGSATPLTWASANGQIAYTHANDGQIWLVNQDGTNARALTAGSQPAASPDGTRIAYINADGFLAVVNLDGTSARRVTQSPEPERLPVWSPDGTRILFVRAGANGDQVFTVAPDDAQQAHQLIADDIAEITDLDWIDANRFAYLSNGQLHTRLFPQNSGANIDTIILEQVSTFDWWMPPQ